MSPRIDVSMTPEEIETFLSEPRVAVLTTMGDGGYPHSVGMWFALEENVLAMWTYGKSQKAVNAARDPRCSLLVEDGLTYGELRGVLVRGDLEVITGVEDVALIGRRLYERYTYPSTGIPYKAGPEADIRRQAAKRIGLRLPLDRVTSWDHSKIGG